MKLSLSPEAIQVIEAFKHLPIGVGVKCPYFNNRRKKVRFGLRALVGKGSVEEIADEITILSLREKVDLQKLSSEELTRFIVLHNLGIDCSGYAYYILEAESRARNLPALSKKLHFPQANGPWRKLMSKIRPVEHAGVATLSHEKNSREISLSAVKPGDFISIIEEKDSKLYNHLLLISAVEGETDRPKRLYYTHSMAWPSDGLFKHGIKEGEIEILNLDKKLTDQNWSEDGKVGEENYTFLRSQKAKNLSLRRLNWF